MLHLWIHTFRNSSFKPLLPDSCFVPFINFQSTIQDKRLVLFLIQSDFVANAKWFYLLVFTRLLSCYSIASNWILFKAAFALRACALGWAMIGIEDSNQRISIIWLDNRIYAHDGFGFNSNHTKVCTTKSLFDDHHQRHHSNKKRELTTQLKVHLNL